MERRVPMLQKRAPGQSRRSLGPPGSGLGTVVGPGGGREGRLINGWEEEGADRAQGHKPAGGRKRGSPRERFWAPRSSWKEARIGGDGGRACGGERGRGTQEATWVEMEEPRSKCGPGRPFRREDDTARPGRIARRITYNGHTFGDQKLTIYIHCSIIIMNIH